MERRDLRLDSAITSRSYSIRGISYSDLDLIAENLKLECVYSMKTRVIFTPGNPSIPLFFARFRRGIPNFYHWESKYTPIFMAQLPGIPLLSIPLLRSLGIPLLSIPLFA